MKEYRIVNKDGKPVFVSSRPILSLSLAESWKIVLDDRDSYSEPHRVQEREYRENEWKDS